MITNVKYMSRLIFAAAACLAFSSAAAAQVPARDLLEFPLGTLAEAPALSRQMPAALWNPAATVLTRDQRMMLGFSALTTPYEIGVEARVLGAAFALRNHITGSASLAQSSVTDIFHTETDP